MKSPKAASLDVLILIAPGFDETLTVQFLASFRQAGIASALVSLTPGLIRSFCGLQVQADLFIDQLPFTVLPRLVLILETHSCASALLADPRVHRLLARTLAAKGMLAILPETQSLFMDVGFSDVMILPEFLKLEPLPGREWVSQLVSFINP
jgi:hypothetical protein